MKKMNLVLLFSAAVVAISAICGVGLSTPPKAGAAGAGADWPCWRGANIDGKSAFKGIKKAWPAAGPTKAWEITINPDDLGDKYNANGSPASPVVQGGVVVIVGRNGGNAGKDIVAACDANTGKELWRKEYAAEIKEKPNDVGYGPRATPCISEGMVYTLSVNGTLNCWDLKTGDNKWTKSVTEDGGDMSAGDAKGWGCCASPIVYEKTLIIKAGGKALILAYDKATGKLLWKAGKGGGAQSSPAVRMMGGKPVLVVFSESGIAGMNVSNGEQLWNIPWKTAYGANVPTPQVEGDTMFITSGYDTGCQAFDVKSGEPKSIWDKNKLVASAASDPVIDGKYVYSFSGQGIKTGSLKCVELATGKQQWPPRIKGKDTKNPDKEEDDLTSCPDLKALGNGSLVLVDGCLVCLTCKGELALVEANPSGFKLLGKVQVFKPEKQDSVYSSPAVAGGKVYVRFNGRLVCYDLTK